VRGYDRHDRPAMQYMGTEIMRKFAGAYFGTEDFWINLMLADMKDRQEEGYDFFICDDCRFPNEIKRLRECGFKVVRLATTRELQLSRGDEGAKATVNLDHPSELALDEYENKEFFDLETDPNDSIDDMVNKISTKFLSVGVNPGNNGEKMMKKFKVNAHCPQCEEFTKYTINANVLSDRWVLIPYQIKCCKNTCGWAWTWGAGFGGESSLEAFKKTIKDQEMGPS